MRLGIDVGGTFTDLLLHDETNGKTFRAKTPSTPEDQSIAVAAGVKLICDCAEVNPSNIELILHGTTVATNAVLEAKGARMSRLLLPMWPKRIPILRCRCHRTFCPNSANMTALSQP